MQQSAVTQALTSLSETSRHDLGPGARGRLIEAITVLYTQTLESMLSCPVDDMLRLRGMAQGYATILKALSRGEIG